MARGQTEEERERGRRGDRGEREGLFMATQSQGLAFSLLVSSRQVGIKTGGNQNLGVAAPKCEGQGKTMNVVVQKLKYEARRGSIITYHILLYCIGTCFS